MLRVAARLAGNVIGVVVVALLTRYLGQEGFGNYTTILAYLFFFGALSDLGLYIITINEINKEGVDSSKFFSAVFSLRFYSGIALMLLAMGMIWFFPYPSIVKQGVLITAISTFFALLDQLQVALYQAKLKMLRVAIAEFAGKIILIAGVFWGISQGVNLLILLWVVVAGQGVQWLIGYLGTQNLVKYKLNFDTEYWKKIIKKTWPVAMSQLFVLVYFKMDTVFLSLLRPPDVAQVEVGIYGASYKILEVLIALVPIFMGLVAPVLAKVWSEGLKDRFRHMYQQAFNTFAIVTWPMVFGGIVLAKPIMNLLAPGFEQSDVILRILLIATGLIFFSHLPTYVVVTLGEQRRMLKAYAISAVLAAILYIALIPVYSYFAAAWITVGIELLVLVLAWRRVAQVTQQKMQWSIFNKAILASIIMSAVLWLLNGWNLFILIVIGVIIYFGAMWLLRAITRDMIKKILYDQPDD